MTGEFTTYYVEADEFSKLKSSGKPLKVNYTPYLTIHVERYLNEDVFEGYIIHKQEYLSTHKHTTIESDYRDKKAGAFTFDGVRFFMITNMATSVQAEGYRHFTFRFLDSAGFSETSTAFMIMPFGFPELNSFYQTNIKEYLKNSDLQIDVKRSDDFTGTDVVADTILSRIQKAEFIICDITNQNKNVFFEIGYAKGIRKNILFLLEQNKPAEFFDVNHIRRIEYSYERPTEFQKLLHDTLISIRRNLQ